MAKIYRVDGGFELVEPANGTDFSLDEMKAIVGGYIEILPIGENLLMVCNEEGKLIGLPTNEIATLYALANGILDCIAGDVLICDSNQIR